MPEALASFSVGKTEARAFERVVNQLTCPSVGEGVEHRHREQDAVEVAPEKAKLDARTMKLACDIVQSADPNSKRQVLE